MVSRFTEILKHNFGVDFFFWGGGWGVGGLIVVYFPALAFELPRTQM